MRKINAILGFAAAMAAMGHGGTSNARSTYSKPEETDEERSKRLREAEIKRNKANGLKEFFYEGISVFAINKKNADKKARQKGVKI